MPTYLYRNLDTGETFEYEQRITDAPLSVHPETGAAVKRLIQPVGIAFKGSGFYVNDSKKSGASKLESKPVGSSDAKAADSATAPATSAPSATPAPAVSSAAAD